MPLDRRFPGHFCQIERLPDMPVNRIFVACPLGDDGSDTRIRSDKLMRHVISPVLRNFVSVPAEQSIFRSDTLAEPGRITTQILRELVSADLVVADVTDTNPNVMYEIGIRQAMLKPMVLLAEKDQRLPFDLNDLRTVFYILDLEHIENVQAELKQHVEKALAGSVSPLDTALFSSGAGKTPEATDDSSGFISILEVCEAILSEARSTKDLVTSVGSILIDLRDEIDRRNQAGNKTTEQEMGMFMFQQLLQNPDAIDKVLPVLQKFAEFGNKSSQPEKPALRARRKG